MAEEKTSLYKRCQAYILLLTALITCIHAGGEGVNNNECLKSYEITRGTSPWQGFTSSYAEEDSAKKIMAETLKGSDFKAITSLEKYFKSGILIIGRNEKLRRVAVEASLFSDLRRADATRNTSGRFLIGTYRDISFKIFKPRELAEFLIESHIINTFWHVESHICLVSEEDISSTYIAHYRGKHIYFTNSRNEGSLDFSIIVEKKTGNMFVEAR